MLKTVCSLKFQKQITLLEKYFLFTYCLVVKNQADFKVDMPKTFDFKWVQNPTIVVLAADFLYVVLAADFLYAVESIVILAAGFLSCSRVEFNFLYGSKNSHKKDDRDDFLCDCSSSCRFSVMRQKMPENNDRDDFLYDCSSRCQFSVLRGVLAF